MDEKESQLSSLNASFTHGLSEILAEGLLKPGHSERRAVSGSHQISGKGPIVPFKVTVSLRNPFAQKNIAPLIKNLQGASFVDLDQSLVAAIEKLLNKAGDSEKTLKVLEQNLGRLLEEWSIQDSETPVLLKDLGIEPRDYLRETLEKLLLWLKTRNSGDRAVCNFVWATGLGKSYLALLLVALLPEDEQVLIVTSSQLLINQLARLFSRLGRSISHVSCAAVPPGVELGPIGQIVLMTNRGASLEAGAAELASLNGKVTHLSRLIRPSLLIVDEMDTTYTMDQWAAVEGWMNQGSVVIAMSATRDHLVKANNYNGPLLDKISVGGVEYVLLRLGRDFYGPTVVDIGLASGIDRKLLLMPKYFQWVLPLHLSVLNDAEADRSFEDICAFVFSQMVRPQYRKWLIEVDGSWKAMIFTARSIERSLYMVEAATEAGIGFSLEAVTSDSAPIEREASIARIEKGEVNGIVGPNSLSRGLDISRLKVLIRLNPRSSMHTTIQEIGRINRAIHTGQHVQETPDSAIVIIDVVAPDWSRYITVPEALRFCGLSDVALAGLDDASPWFEKLKRSPNSLRPKIGAIWGDTLHKVFSWFIYNFPEYSQLLNEKEFERVLFFQYIRDQSRIGSGLKLSESDKACVHVCITDIVHIFELEDDPQWLSVENILMSGTVEFVTSDIFLRLDEIVEEWMEKYQLEEYSLRHKFSLRLSNASESGAYYHVDVWEELLGEGGLDVDSVGSTFEHIFDAYSE